LTDGLPDDQARVAAAKNYIQKMERNMNLKKQIIALFTVVIIAGLTVGSPAQNLSGKAAKKRNDLTGTWLVNIEFNFGDTAADSAAASKFGSKFLRMARTVPPTAQAQSPADTPTQAPFNTLITFHTDGTFTENSQLDYAPPPPTTPGHGVWEKSGDGEFAATLYGVAIDGFDTANLAGTYRERIRLNTNSAGDQFTGTAAVEIFDTTGALVFSFTGTFEGRRAEIVPAP
jgi:hypothetical protein